MERVPPLCGVHSEFDLRSSVFRLSKGVKRIASMGYRSVIVVDPQPVGWMKFVRACEANDIKPIVALPRDDTLLVALDTAGVFELFRIFNGLMDPEDAKHVDEISLPIWHVRYILTEEKRALELLSLMSSRETPKGLHLPQPSEYIAFLMKEGADLDALFELEERVRTYHLKLKHEFPVTATKEELESTCLEFLGSVGKLNDTYRRRLLYELGEMERAGILDYIATIGEVVRTCENVSAWVGPGRGSAVGSLVCYALGLTRVDPVEHGLLFERFLNPARRELPDIDIDVEDRKRQEVIEALRKRFGKFSVLNVLTFGTLGEKLLRNEIQRTSRTLKKPLNVDERTFRILLGLPYHRSSHAAGLIISKLDLRTVAPVDQDTGLLLMDMEDLKELGLVKIDLLGLKTLSFLRDVSKAAGVKEDEIPLDDAASYEMISRGLTAGIFQLESRQATLLSISISPKNIDELSDLIALNRPGPLQSGMVDEYIRHGEQGHVEYLHPSLEKVLSKTRGTLIYQEQVMELAMELASFSAEEADVLRRAMAKKDATLLQKLKPRFVEGAMANGLSEESANVIFDWIYNFAGYAFNRSHSIAYAHLTYLSAYLKAHAPRFFYRTHMVQNAGDVAKCWRALNEMRYLGIRVLGVGGDRGDGVAVPVECVKGVGPQIARTIESVLDEGLSFEDTVERLNHLGVHSRLLENLVRAGVFDDRVVTRSSALKTLRKFSEGLTEPVVKLQRLLFGITHETPEEEEWESPQEKVLMEMESLGFPITVPIPPEDLERFRDADLCEIAVRFSRGVIPFVSVRWGDTSVIGDGRCAIAVREELPPSGVVFLDLSSHNVVKGISERPKRVERVYRRLLDPKEITASSEENVLVVDTGTSRIVVEGAVASAPDEVFFS